ncbi:MAG: saccharopine dehydrogenase NADP-binding domain-containing protein [Candidatus Bathyarchaeota archaeon]|nr:saccharopine dehydrogenase NADP-binding domain-containing protein [Candidatus Bathyarchaeota archaeon]
MKVLVLGVGKMGYGLLKDLDAQSHVDEIVAADMNQTQAQAFAERVGGEKISVVKLDATDKKETVKLMKQGFDVVAAALPRPFCDAAVDAAIEAGIGWADVAASFSTIFNQHEKAKKAGVSIVPHIGLDIGIDRVLCGVGARKLDHTDGMIVWCGGFPQKGTEGYENPLQYKISWYWPYAVDSNLRTSTVLINGETVTLENLSDPEEIDFPEPIGRTEAYTTGGLKDVIDHLDLKGVKTAIGKTVRWPGHSEFWTKLKKLHLLDQEEINVRGQMVKPYDVFIALGHKHLQYGPDEGDAICQKVKIWGVKDGEPMAYIYEFIDLHDFENDISAMARTTAYPCSIVAQMIAKGEFDKPGVIHPAWIGYDEKLSDKFFKELAVRNINITEYEKQSLP